MLTRDEVLAAVRSGRRSECLDGRDYARLSAFFPVADWVHFGFGLQQGAEPPEPTPWTRENLIAQLRQDVAFGFEKALNQRGISSGLMYETVKMWLWCLGDPLMHHDAFAQYGLPLFRATAAAYEFPNPIGADRGDEDRYAAP